jgi:hypothetical protein
MTGFKSKREMAQQDDDIQDYVRPWVGLTDEEIGAIWSQIWYDFNHGKLSALDGEEQNTVVVFGQAIEQALKEKNT